MALEYCEAELTDHTLVQCGNYAKGGVSAYAVLTEDHGIEDFTSQAEWEAAIAAGEAKVVKQVKMNYPDASAITGTNPVGGETADVTDGYTHTFTGNDYNALAANDEFYEQLNPRKTYLAWYMPKSNTIQVNVVDAVSWNCTPFIPEGESERQGYTVNATWESDVDVLPMRVTAPAGIFTV
jgi:hypothetical protein